MHGHHSLEGKMDCSSIVSGKLACYMAKTKMRSIPCPIKQQQKFFGRETSNMKRLHLLEERVEYFL